MRSIAMKSLAAAAIAGVVTVGGTVVGGTVVGATVSAPAAQPRMAAAPGDPPVPTLPRPQDFVDRVDNPYLPMSPGTRWVYRSRTADGAEVIKVTVMEETKLIQGITATVVRDRATLGGELIEDTFDWFAQDRLGNVWYLGEDTTSYEPGKPPSQEGSWEAGVDGAQAGLAMPAHSEIGRSYRQEFKVGEAEDIGVVLDRTGQVRVTAGAFKRVWMTKDTTPLEPDLIEYKFYAPGVGLVLELGAGPDLETVQLVKFHEP